MIVLRRCPAWKGLAMLGLENSTIICLPAPDAFVPYSPELSARSSPAHEPLERPRESSWIVPSVSAVSVGVWQVIHTKPFSLVADSR